MTIPWQDVSFWFEHDGAWRDIYVLPTTTADWQQFLDLVRVLDPQPSFTIDGEAAPLPPLVSEIFPIKEHASPFLRFYTNGIYYHAHFFCDEEIELDFDPVEIRDGADFANLLTFLETLGNTLRKRLILTPENCQEMVLLEYLPESSEFILT